MMRFNLILLLCLVFSCNSNEKKPNTTINPKKAKVETSSELQLSINKGKTIYNNVCITCHMGNGKGIPRAFPPLADSDYLRDNQNNSIKGLKKGMSGEIIVNNITYNSAMPPSGLSNNEIADVMNYINNSWGNKIDNFITPEKVSNL